MGLKLSLKRAFSWIIFDFFFHKLGQHLLSPIYFTEIAQIEVLLKWKISVMINCPNLLALTNSQLEPYHLIPNKLKLLQNLTLAGVLYSAQPQAHPPALPKSGEARYSQHPNNIQEVESGSSLAAQEIGDQSRLHESLLK